METHTIDISVTNLLNHIEEGREKISCIIISSPPVKNKLHFRALDIAWQGTSTSDMKIGTTCPLISKYSAAKLFPMTSILLIASPTVFCANHYLQIP